VFEKIVLRDPAPSRKVTSCCRRTRRSSPRAQRTARAAIEHCRKGDGAQADPNVLRKAAHAYIGSLRRHMDIEHLHMFPLRAAGADRGGLGRGRSRA
jgi:hypothetical protein